MLLDYTYHLLKHKTANNEHRMETNVAANVSRASTTCAMVSRQDYVVDTCSHAMTSQRLSV